MNDGYDIYCIQKLGELPSVATDPYKADDVTCACAHYLAAEGYESLSNQLISKRAMALSSAAIPTTTNQGEHNDD